MNKTQLDTNKQTIILSIDPGTQYLGVAVFVNGDLVYYAVKTIPTIRPVKALLHSVTNAIDLLIGQFEANVLAIKRIVPHQKSEALSFVVSEEIKIAASRAGLTVKEYDIAQVRTYVCKSPEATKPQATEQLCRQYPELTEYYDPESKARMRHYGHLYDAVAVGLACAMKATDPDQTPNHIEQQLLF
jgi:Holliday junction resolvasome RuvABC endonuclease subunit